MRADPRRLTAELLAHALTLPEAWEDHPWGENVAKVGKKVFVFFGVPDPRGAEMILCVKLPHSGLRALDRGFVEPAGYGLGKSGWVVARVREGEQADVAELRRWIEESYRAIAPKKLVAALDGAPRKAPPQAAARKPVPRRAPARRPAPKPGTRRRG